LTKGREVGTGFRALFDYTVIAVDRAAQCFADGGRSQDDLFGWAFWDLMYGPIMDGDDGPRRGMFYIDFDYD